MNFIEQEARDSFKSALQKRLLTVIQTTSKNGHQSIFFQASLDASVGSFREFVNSLGPQVQINLPTGPGSPSPKLPLNKGATAKLNERLSRLLSDYQREADELIRRAPFALGVFPEATGWKKEGEARERYSPENYFFNAHFKGEAHHTHVMPVIDYVLGGDAGLFLRRMLWLSLFEHWHFARSGKPGYFDSIFTALLTGQKNHLADWYSYPPADRHVPPTTTKSCELLCCHLQNVAVPSSLRTAKSGSQFDKVFYEACLALTDRDADALSGACGSMAGLWPRTEFAVWNGRYNPFVCVPAISLLRAAIRCGLDPVVPKELAAYSALITLSDPTLPDSGYALYPGADLLGKADEISLSALLMGR